MNMYIASAPSGGRAGGLSSRRRQPWQRRRPALPPAQPCSWAAATLLCRAAAGSGPQGAVTQGGRPHGQGSPGRDPRRKLAERHEFCPSPAAVRVGVGGGYCVRVGVFKGPPALGWGPTRGSREGRGCSGWFSRGGLGGCGDPFWGEWVGPRRAGRCPESGWEPGSEPMGQPKG